MKKTIYTLLGLLLAAGLTSCQDWFIEKPEVTGMDQDEVFSTAKNAEGAIAEAYATILSSGLPVLVWNNSPIMPYETTEAIMGGEDLCRLFTLCTGRLRVLGCPYRIVNLVKTASRCPRCVRSVVLRLVFPVFHLLRCHAREGFFELVLRDLCGMGGGFPVSVVKSSLFLRQLNAFFRNGSFLHRYGSVCPG